MNRLLSLESSCLLVVDIQEKFVSVIDEYERVVAKSKIMIQAAGMLGVPVIVSEQYPKGLGQTVSELSEVYPEKTQIHDKTAFGCLGDVGLTEQIAALGKKQIVVVGIETHVCVNQTVHQLLNADYQVHLIEDALGSRSSENRDIGIAKMRASGAVSSCVEMALFEWMGDAKHPRFKDVQALIK